MKRDMDNQKNLKEEILNDTNRRNNAPEVDEKLPGDRAQVALDDVSRVKVLSPGRLVAKRFFRNKLAIVGMGILLFVFAFSFLGVWISPYGETQTFLKKEERIYDYAEASYRTSYEMYTLDSGAVNSAVRQRIQLYISEMKSGELSSYDISNSSVPATEKYKLINRGDQSVYVLQKQQYMHVASYSLNNVSYVDMEFSHPDFTQEILSNINEQFFFYGGQQFAVLAGARGVKEIYHLPGYVNVLAASNYTLNTLGAAGTAILSGTGALNEIVYKLSVAKGLTESFTAVGKTFEMRQEEDSIYLYDVTGGGAGARVFEVGDFIVRSSAGFDNFDIGFKAKVREVIDRMIADVTLKTEFVYETVVLIPEFVYDEDGQIIEEETTYTEELTEAEFVVERTNDRFVIRNNQEILLLDVYSPPSGDHWLGTDTNGMDALTRMMYGGRISLTIGFVVVIIEVIIGVILGGIAGYFGKWADQLIMRIVDIFNCIPYMPILIILGAMFDKLQLGSYQRIMWLMIVLGVLGWPGIARLVRGQILSFREQEFMIAAEATGISAWKRIFKHLVPNVMPQLIVTATMGLGSIIITESTLSFLGLGAKYPMATWGAMINNVSSAYALKNFIFIWVPVGLLISLTVIAFNFVGDGLRDAFDPKMKR